jgi:hypothetical protein
MKLTSRCPRRLGLLMATALLATSAQAQLELPTPFLATTGQLSGVVVSPVTMYTIAVTPSLWNGLFNLVVPYMAPYSDDLRKLALKKTPRLRPLPSAPRPPAQVFANSYTQIFSFGDSMSDTGNLYAAMRGNGAKIPLPTSPNYEGRFSNGPVVLEAMANACRWSTTRSRAPAPATTTWCRFTACKKACSSRSRICWTTSPAPPPAWTPTACMFCGQAPMTTMPMAMCSTLQSRRPSSTTSAQA